MNSVKRQQLIDTVRQYFKILGTLDENHRRDVDAQIALMSPDVSYCIPFLEKPIQLNGHAGVRKIFELIQGKFADIRYDIERWTVDEDAGIVVVEMTSERTLVHDGSTCSNQYVLVFTLTNGLISDFREYLNPLNAKATSTLIDPHA